MPKIPLEKGYSQMDWLRLTQRDPNLNGLHGKPLRQDITMAEVRKHKSPDDAWMVLNDLVFNIGPYLRFHPGGSDILLKAAGRDATSLFMKYHPWVNVAALMSKCLVGRLAAPFCAPSAAAPNNSEPQATSPLGSSKNATDTPNDTKPQATALPGSSKNAAAASDDAEPQAMAPLGSSKNAAAASDDAEQQDTAPLGAFKNAAAASDNAEPQDTALLGSSKNAAAASDNAEPQDTALLGSSKNAAAASDDAEPQDTASLGSVEAAAAASDSDELQATTRLGSSMGAAVQRAAHRMAAKQAESPGIQG